MKIRRCRLADVIGLSILGLLLASCAGPPVRASLAIQGGTETQKRLVETLYGQEIPGKFRRAQPVSVRFLPDDAMNASVRSSDSHETDDDRDTIDGIYQDDPPLILLRASRPASEMTLVFTHEYGHFVWGSLLSENQRAVFRRIHAVDKDERHLVTDYAEASPEEGFAETFGYYVLHARQLAVLEPRAYAFLSALAFSSHDGTRQVDARQHREWEEQDPPQ